VPFSASRASGCALVLIACGGQSQGSGPVQGSTLSGGVFGNPTTIEQHILTQPILMASDGTNLFWIDSGGGVWRDPVGGGAATQLASGGNYIPGLFSLDATNVYFVVQGGIASVPKQGGATSTVITTSGDIMAATVAGGIAYWIEQENENPPTPEPGIDVKSASLTGGATATLCTRPGLGIFATTIAVSGSLLYLPRVGTSLLSTIPIAGLDDAGSPSPVNLPASDGFNVLTAGADGVYFDSSPILYVTSSGAVTTISSEANQPKALAGRHVPLLGQSGCVRECRCGAEERGNEHYDRVRHVAVGARGRRYLCLLDRRCREPPAGSEDRAGAAHQSASPASLCVFLSEILCSAMVEAP
jgi:hypothetical protein